MLAGKLIHFLSSRYTELALFVLLVVIAISFHFNGLYGQDAHEYLRMMRELKDVFFRGKEISHTIFPVMYPLTGFFLVEIIRNDFIAMQLVSMVSLILAFYFLKKLLSLMYGETRVIQVYLLLFFALSPYVLRFSLLSMSDMLSMALIVIATFHAVNFFVKQKNFSAALSFFFCCCALTTRYAALIIIIPILIFAGWNLIRRKHWPFLFLSVILSMLPLIPDLLLRNRLLFFQFPGRESSFGAGEVFIDYGANAYSWSLLNFFRKDFLNPDGLQHYSQWNILYSLFNIVHPAFLFAGIFLLFFLRKKDFESPLQKLFALIIILYSFYLAGLHYQSTRYLLQTFPFIILIFFPAFLRCCEKILKKKEIPVAAAAGVMALQLFLFFYSSKNIYQLNQVEQTIAAELRHFPEQTIYTCSINGALQSYGVANAVVDLFPERISGIQLPALVLFNEREFSDHFRDKNPMINFAFLQSNYTLLPLQSFAGGWQLFEVKK